MKKLFTLCLLAYIVMLSVNSAELLYPRGCIYIDGMCAQECEEGTYGYAPGCTKITPEATCDQPNPVMDMDDSCDFSACYCDSPTVRDTVSGKCVTLDNCPKK